MIPYVEAREGTAFPRDSPRVWYGGVKLPWNDCEIVFLVIQDRKLKPKSVLYILEAADLISSEYDYHQFCAQYED